MRTKSSIESIFLRVHFIAARIRFRSGKLEKMEFFREIRKNKEVKEKYLRTMLSDSGSQIVVQIEGIFNNDRKAPGLVTAFTLANLYDISCRVETFQI